MGRITQGTNMIKLEDTLTVLERSNDGYVRSLMLIRKEAAESYADYWEEQQTIYNIQSDIQQLLNNLKG